MPDKRLRTPERKAEIARIVEEMRAEPVADVAARRGISKQRLHQLFRESTGHSIKAERPPRYGSHTSATQRMNRVPYEEAREKYEAGESIPNLMELYDVPRHTIVKRLGIPKGDFRNRPRKPRYAVAIPDDELIRLRMEGLTYRELATAFNCSTTTIMRRLRTLMFQQEATYGVV